MTLRNKYCIAGANGLIQLSIPLQNGRNQRAAMKDIQIAPGNWQVQHWRTLTAAYARSPYFEYYAQSLQVLFETPFQLLVDFNNASLLWLEKVLKKQLNKTITETYNKTYENATDLRITKFKVNNAVKFPEYYQVFSDRTDFISNLSMLDLLFSEGPATIAWIEENKEAILEAVG